MQPEQAIAESQQQPNAKSEPELGELPLRKECPPEDMPQRQGKDINKTVGGKITTLLTNYIVGGVGNSSLSLAFTYGLNPRDDVKKFKDNVTNFFTSKFGSNSTKTLDSVRSTVEVSFMFIAGFIMTAVMTPMILHREKIAYKINQLIGKDKDVLPDNMKPKEAPKTVEDRIEQELNKRVRTKQGIADLWIARFVAVGGVMAGDYFLNRSSRAREAAGKDSIDTLSWKAGQKAYGHMKPEMVTRWNNWFARHDASIGDMRKNMKDHFNRLEETERQFAKGGPLNEDRMVVAEQARIVTKEVGWTFVCALWVEKLTGLFNKYRVHKQQEKALQNMTKEGFVPKGYKAVLEKNGCVKLEAMGGTPERAPSKQWAKQEEEKRTPMTAGFAESVQKQPVGGQIGLA